MGVEAVGQVGAGCDIGIATLLEISPWTVTDHLRAIFAKFGVNNRGELLALALQRSQPTA